MGRRVLAAVCGGLLLAVVPALPAEETAASAEDSAYENIALFTRVLEQVRVHYVDEDKVAYQDLVFGALRGMLQSLDPHSQFLDPDTFHDMQEDTAGEFGGLGVVISIRDGLLTIVAPMEDTPGFEAGLLPGDRIVEIEGESTEGMGLQEAVKRLRGKPGTDVAIRILHRDANEIKDVVITRAEIKVSSVKDAKMIGNDIGYLRITQFNEPTAGAMEEALADLDDQGMQGLVIDVRNNPGGLLSSAVEVSQLFLRRGRLIVFTRGRDGEKDEVYRAGGRTHYPDLPLVVLVNQGSASAAEILAGALKDHHRAVLVGERTFGKGSVQSVFPMNEGSAVRLTTARYYTPSEQVIHEQGIEPHLVVPLAPETWMQLLRQRSRPKLAEPEEDGAPVVDRQLERAVHALRAIMIFRDRRAGWVSRRFAGK